MTVRRFTAGSDKIKARRVGDAPAIGNVPRASSENAPVRTRRSARPVQKKKYPKNFVAWSLLIFFATVSVLVVAIVRNVRNKVLVTQSSNESEKLTDLDKAFDDSEKPDVPDLKQDEAVNLVTQALANRDPGLMRDFFILGDGDEPAEAMKELVRILDAEGKITRTEWLASKFPDESAARQVVVYTSTGETDETLRSRRAQFAPDADGKWRIDLDAYLRKCEPPLAEVAAAESGTFIVRIFVAEETSYRGMYSDKTKWRAYSLTSPDCADSLYAYAKRGSSQDKAMRHIMISDESLHHATLAIVKQPDSDPRQFEVSRVIADDWVPGETDFDKSF